MKHTRHSPRTRRHWTVLGAYFGVVAMSHMLWLNLAPLASVIQERYRVGETAVGFLLLVFPLLYLLLSWHAGTWVDRMGYRSAILLGSLTTAAFSLLRTADSHFAWLLLGQVGIAVGQPYIVNSISALVADQFEPGQRATATGIAAAGMLVGMALGLGLTPVLHERFGLGATMACFAAAAALFTLVFHVATRGIRFNASVAPGQASGAALAALLGERTLRRLCALWFLAYGGFNGLTTWLEPMVGQHGIGAGDAGLGGACLIVGGIAGCLVVPPLADRWHLRKPLAVLCCLAALLLVWPLCTTRSAMALFGLGTALGFLFLPGYPIVLAMCEEAAGPARVGAAVSLLMLAGNAGAVVAIALMPLVNSADGDWHHALQLLVLLFTAALLVSLGLPRRPRPRPQAGQT